MPWTGNAELRFPEGAVLTAAPPVHIPAAALAKLKVDMKNAGGYPSAGANLTNNVSNSFSTRYG